MSKKPDALPNAALTAPEATPWTAAGRLTDARGTDLEITPERFRESAARAGVDPAELWQHMQQQGLQFATTAYTNPALHPVAAQAEALKAQLRAAQAPAEAGEPPVAEAFPAQLPNQNPRKIEALEIASMAKQHQVAAASAAKRTQLKVEDFPNLEAFKAAGGVPQLRDMRHFALKQLKDARTEYAEMRAETANTDQWRKASGFERQLEVPVERGGRSGVGAGTAAQVVGAQSRLNLLDEMDTAIAGGNDAKLFELVGGRNADPQLVEYWNASPEARARIRATLQEGQQGAAEAYAENQKALNQLPQNPRLVKAIESGQATELLSAIIDDPAIISQVGIESIVSVLPGLVATPLMGPAALGINSLVLEYGNKMGELLAEQGVDTTDPQAFIAALQDPQRLAALKTRAFKKGIPVAAFNTLSIGVASKVLAPTKVFGKPLTKTQRNATNLAAQLPVQGAMGAAGEATGQQLADGEINAAEVTLEGVAEVFGAPMEMLAIGREYRAEKTQAKRDAETQVELDRQGAIEQGLKDGDVTPFLDPKSKLHNPQAAVSVLVQRLQDDTLPVSERQATQTKIEEIAAAMEQDLQTQEKLAEFATPAGKQKLEAGIARNKTELAALAPDSEEFTAKAEALQAKEAKLAEVNTLDAKALKKNTQALEKLRKQLAMMREVRKFADGKANATPEYVNQLLEGLEQPEKWAAREDTPVEGTPSQVSPSEIQARRTRFAQEIVRTVVRNPEAITPEKATALAEDMDLGLSEDERLYLRKLAASRQAQNEFQTAEGVSHDIYNGDSQRQMRGLREYRDDFTHHLGEGNLQRAQTEVDGVQNFARSHRAKAKAAMEALKLALQSDEPVSIARNAADPGSWQVLPRALSDAERKETGGLTIDLQKYGLKAAQTLVSNLRTEAAAIEATAEELDAALKTRQPAPKPQEAAPKAEDSTPKAVKTTPKAEQRPAKAIRAPEAPAEPEGESLPAAPTADASPEAKAAHVEQVVARLQTLANHWLAPLGLDDQGVTVTAEPLRRQSHLGQYRPDSRTIVLNEGLLAQMGGERNTELELSVLEGLAHEVGHAVDYLLLQRATPEERTVFEAAYQKWLADQKGKSKAEVRMSRHTGVLAARIQEKGQHTNLADEYLFKRSEWFADQVARYLMDETLADDAPAFRKLVRNAANKFREVYARIATTLGWPVADQAVAEYLDRVKDAIARDLAPWEDPADTKQQAARSAKTIRNIRESIATAMGLTGNKHTDFASRGYHELYMTPGKGRQPTAGDYSLEFKAEPDTQTLKVRLRWQSKRKGYVSDAVLTIKPEDYATVGKQLYRDFRTYLQSVAQDPNEHAFVYPYAHIIERDWFVPAVAAIRANQNNTNEGPANVEPEAAPSRPPQSNTGAQTPPTQTPAAKTTGAREGAEPNPDVAETQRNYTGLSLFQRVFTPVVGTLGPKLFAKTNLVLAYFSQKQTSDRDTTERPLVAEQAFFSQLLQDNDQALALLKQYAGVESFSDKQQQLIEGVVNTIMGEGGPSWIKVLEQLIRVNPNTDYHHQEYLQFFLDPAAQNPVQALDENLKVAIALSAFGYVMEHGKGPEPKRKKDINRFLGREDHAPVSTEEMAAFGVAGENRDMTIEGLGRVAAQALGLKAHKGAPVNVQSQLEQALGQHALALLLELGLVEQERFTVYTADAKTRHVAEGYYLDISDLPPAANAQEREFVTVRVKLQDAQARRPVPVAGAKRISELAKGTEGIFEKLFAVELLRQEPALAPPGFEQKTIRGGQQRVPTYLSAILERLANHPFYLREDSRKVFQQLPRELLEQIAGVQNLPERQVQKTRRKALESKNRGLVRELDDFFDWFETLAEKGYDQPFYMHYDVMRQQRVQIKGKINPQANKTQRFALAMPEWKSTVRLDNRDGSLDKFKLAVALGLGISIDKKEADTALAELEEKRQSPAIKAGVAALQKLLYSEQPLTTVEQTAIAEAVVQGEEHMHSLDALMNLAHWEQAQLQGETHFTTEMMLEVDGITNGPMLSMIFLAAGEDLETLWAEARRGGFYRTGDGYENYVGWKNAAGEIRRDLYEDQAHRIIEQMKARLEEAPELSPIYDTIFSLYDGLVEVSEDKEITAGKKGRKAVKTPLTAMMFGSAIRNGVDGMADDLIDLIYEQIEIIYNKDDTAAAKQDELQELLRQVNSLIQFGLQSQKKAPSQRQLNAAKLNVNMSLEQAMHQFELKGIHLDMLKRAFGQTVGRDVGATLEAKFDTLLRRRQRYNRSTQAAYQIYHQVAQVLRRRFIDQQAAQGAVATGLTGEPLQDLSRDGERQLRRLLHALEPRMHTWFSKQSGELREGLAIGKQRTQIAGRGEVPYTSNATFAKKLPHGNKSLTSHGSQAVLKDPGVAMLIMAIHSSDSAIAAWAYERFQALHLHDAEGAGLSTIYEVAQALNQGTFEVLLSYSPGQEMVEALTRTIDGFSALLAENPNDPELLEAYRAAGEALVERFDKKARESYEDSGLDPISFALQEAQLEAHDAEVMKLDFLAELAHVNQYGGLANAAYTVTEADRQRVAEARDRLKTPDTQHLKRAQALAQQAWPDTYAAEATSETRQGLLEPLPTPLADAVIVESLEAGEMSSLLQRQGNSLRHKAQQSRHANKRNALYQQIQAWDKAAAAYARHGDLNQALAHAFPTPAQQRQAKAALKTLATGAVRDASDVLTAPDAVQLTFLDHLMREDATLAEQVAAVKAHMLLNHTGLEQALAEALPYRQQQTLLSAMQRHYNGRRQTLWGEVGRPIVAQDAELVRFLETTPGLTVSKLIHQLKRHYLGKDATSQFQKRLLAQLERLIDGNLPILYIQPDTPAELHPGTEVRQARGFYHQTQDGQAQLAFKGAEFVEAAITPELMLHELLHAALDNEVVAAEAGQSSPEAQALVQELERLRVAAETFVNDDPALQSVYAPAVENVRELIAWGLSNAGFQDAVLNKIKIKRTERDNTLVQGMQRFLTSIAQFLFGKKVNPVGMESGLAVLVADTAGLFAQVAQAKADPRRLYSPQQSPGTNQTATPESYSLNDMLQALGQGSRHVSAAFATQLGGLFSRIETRLHGPGRVYSQRLRLQNINGPRTAWLNAQLQGQTPFTSEVLGHDFGLREQEAFAVEQVEIITRHSLDTTKQAYRQLREVFLQARKKLTPADLTDQAWDSLTQAEQARLEQQYQTVFYGQSPEYLSRFMALGLGSEVFNRALQNVRAGDPRRFGERTLSEKLQMLFNWLLRQLGWRIRNAYDGQQVDQQLEALFVHLVGSEQKRQNRLQARAAAAYTQTGNQFERVLETAMGKARAGVAKATGSHWVQRQHVFVKAPAKLANLVATDRADWIVQSFRDYRNHTRPQQKQTVLDGLLTDTLGTTDNNAVFYELLRGTKRLEVERKRVITALEEQVLEAFERPLTEEEKKTLTQLLRLDLSSLLGRFDMAQIRDLVRDPQHLTQAIQTLEQQLNGTRFADYYRFQGKNLGYYLATGSFKRANGQLNAHNIAMLYGTPAKGDVSATAAAEVTTTLDPLVTLYALKYLDPRAKARAEALLTEEANRGTQNGIQFLLQLHKRLLAESRETLFDDSPVHMQKGYLPDIQDPHKAIQVANAADGARLEAQGWYKGERVSPDPADPNQEPRWIYVHDDGGMQERVSGIASTTDDHTKGNPMATAPTVRRHIKQQQRAEIEAQLTGRTQFDDQAVAKTGNKLVPVYDRQGNVVNYRYLMSNRLRDSENLLNRDNRVEKNLALLAGRMFDKQTNKAQNRKLIEALYAQYQAEFVLQPEAYIRVSATAEDPEAREIYKLLPEDTRQALLEVWGQQELWVRADTLYMAFGYRKRSLADLYQEALLKEADQRKYFEQLVVGVFRYLLEPWLKEKAALRVRQAEHVTHELIMILKDTLVVKNPLVLMLNLGSAFLQLLWNGVPPHKAVKGIVTAIKSTFDYQRDHKQLLKLKRRLSSGADTSTQIQQEIMELEQELQRNPMHEMVEAGMMQTIVEDIDPDDETYTYKSKMLRKVDKYVDRMPSVVKTVGRNAFMTHDTRLYKFMHRSTMLVDLSARYVLHEHLTTRAKNPLSKKASLRRVYEEFVAYDVPQHPVLQYLDDHGLIRFAKYYVRIQKVILRLFRDNPARSLQMLFFGNLLDLPLVSEGSVVEQVGNPLKPSVLDLPETVGNMATFQAMGAVLK